MSGGFYRAFEDRYRGTRAMIRGRLAVYLPFLKPLSDNGMSSGLDLGCGRGEWLELLGEAGFDAKGVDMDEGMLAACHERGLNAISGDALEVLRAQQDDSLAVVSAFHLVEHITFDMVQTLIREAMRVLQPGGLLILETPNSENLVVGSSSFYDDPSHLRPIPPKLLAFAVEYGGFARHRILRLQESEQLHEELPIQLFDVLGGVSPDYGVIAQKTGAPANLSTLDVLFDASYGVDLHTLAQRYQKQIDTLHIELGQLHGQQNIYSRALQEQVEKINSQIAHLHSTTVALSDDIAEHETTRTELVGQVETINAQIAHVYSTTVALSHDIAELSWPRLQ
jgi:SAM-dependent methyltransferase